MEQLNTVQRRAEGSQLGGINFENGPSAIESCSYWQFQPPLGRKNAICNVTENARGFLKGPVMDVKNVQYDHENTIYIILK